jgi:hypothetical protein
LTLEKVPYILVMGDKEAASEMVSLPVRGLGDKGQMPLQDFLLKVQALIEGKSTKLWHPLSIYPEQKHFHVLPQRPCTAPWRDRLCGRRTVNRI